ncbi:hypothetical protein A2W14_00240 [Candidatus Gottesmanbacteria bacterium RBG_16_37_8]|uniref:UDP-N-acetylglucosamine--N-acetylmuramyl-(pentapeptide) pyrophosphoryl-undecaprenol N-acetylglucosamine transferase n=1 Tax=Candidatus Gottesmanbacteria bacterium RBG_16_37_8 TaxID=1798371 RepID=A0A1F5YRT4_9BACT|nr:MAG: hypothetical protein A2W14_00240 [Candidatus Gottesmanbacteria bacterium RBG_16_37_8]
MKKNSLFICGGHFSPAIALIEQLRQHSNLSLYYVGRKYATEGDNALSLEYKEITRLKIPFLILTTGRLQRHFSKNTILSLLKIPQGFISSLSYLNKYKPDLVVSFGSYIALPVCLSAKILGIPVITHEQTRILGLTNRIIALFAKYTCLTFIDTKSVPSFSKTVVTGLPIRKSIIKPIYSGLTSFGNSKLPLIYITGGSLGSQFINALIYEILPDLLKKYRIIHVCGVSSNSFDYHRLSKLRSTLEKKYKDNYYLTPTLEYQKVGEVLKNSSLVVGRSGANSVAEILEHGKKAILIPLPFSATNEQMSNALFLKDLGLAEILNQNNLKGKILKLTIDEIVSNNKIKIPKNKIQFQTLNGARKLADLIMSAVNS